MLSNTVSNALKQFGDEDVAETARFVGMMDKFFDALNVHNYNHGYHSNKKFRDEEDFRLKVINYATVNCVCYLNINSGLKKTS